MFSSRKKRHVRHATDPDYSLTNPNSDEISLEPPKKKRRWGWKFFGIFLLLVILVGAAAAALAYFYIDSAVLKGEKEGRINVMVLGVDDAASLSDTIMLMSVDTRAGQQHKAAMISVPRDLYVDIPEFGNQKINAAYTYGQNNDYPGGGPALTQKVVSEVTGQTIHYYAALDFTGFRQMIDAVGGIDVDVKNPIDDPYYPDYKYGYSRFKLAVGPQHLDGEKALRYARSRETSSDFDRAARQQQVILALRAKLVSKGTLLDKGKLDAIQAAIKDHLKTDMSLRESAKFADLLRKIPEGNITRHVIDSSNLLASSQRFGYALIPKEGFDDYSEIHTFVGNIFTATGNTLPPQQQ